MSDFEKAIGSLEAKLDSALNEASEQSQKFGKVSTELTGKVDALSQELKESQSALEELAQKQAEGFAPKQERKQSVGSIFTGSESAKAMIEGKSKHAHVEVKNTILGSDGTPLDPSDIIVAPDRLAGIVPGAFRALSILDVLPMGQTSSNQIEYTQEDTWTNDATS